MTKPNLFKNIKVLVFDIDGVFTDTRILINENGDFLRTMNTRDGYAVKLARRAGLQMAAITGGISKGVENRLRALGIEIIHSGIMDKKPVFEKMISDHGWNPEEILYIGDDLPDIPCILLAGTGACPADAVPEVKAVSDFVSSKNGGDFCIRDLIERILKEQDKWPF